MNYFHFPVSFGTLLVSWNSRGLLSQIAWSEGRLAIWQRARPPGPLEELIDRIREYFYRGEPIGEVPWEHIEQDGWTEFQRSVYHVISSIPHGETRTYGWVASRLGKATASRAVGQALRKNPLPILIPCHRVLAASSLGGFMGKTDLRYVEVKLKQKLMSLEEQYKCPIFSFLPPETGRLDFQQH